MSHDDFAFEPVRGLPAALPAGEELLWQGVPDWKCMAIRVYHARKVAVYFAILVAARIAFGISDGTAPVSLALSCLWIATLGSIAVGTLSLLAYLGGRMTVYSVTSARVLIRHGVAVPMTVNIPFTAIQSANLKRFANGMGEVSFALAADQRIGYLVNWPNVRPGYFAQPQPTFRALPDAAGAADVLSRALAAHAGVKPVKFGSGAPQSASGAGEPRAAATA